MDRHAVRETRVDDIELYARPGHEPHHYTPELWLPEVGLFMRFTRWCDRLLDKWHARGGK